jgi:hypothetical protein
MSFIYLVGLGALVYYFWPTVQQEVKDLKGVIHQVIQNHGIDVGLTNRASVPNDAPRTQDSNLRDGNFYKKAKSFSVQDMKKLSAQVSADRMAEHKVMMDRPTAFILPKAATSYRPVIASSLSGDLVQ